MGKNKVYTVLAIFSLAAVALAGCTVMSSDGPQTRRITFWVEEQDWTLHPNVETPVWAFCAEGDGVEPVWDGPCGVPGPTIRVNRGDTIVLTFRNTHAIPHTVHFHGQHPFMPDMNGNGALADQMVVGPHEELTVQWVAKPAGTFIYHCHFDTPTHMEMGMSGAFIVDDPDDPRPADHDFIAVLDEWQVGTTDRLGNMPAYNFFTINGRSFPLTQPMFADPGDRVRIHMVNAGYEFHAMHLHGYTPDAWEGVAGWKHAVPTDVREIAPGQSVVLDFIAEREGVWLFHDHVVPRVTAGGGADSFGAYPRGMLSILVVGDAYAAAVPEVAAALLAAAAGDVPAAAPETPESVGSAESSHGSDSEQVSDPGAAAKTSRMASFAFEPELKVAAGTQVTWVNDDSVYHTVTLADGTVDSGRIEAGASWSHVFDKPGTYEYYCKPHAYQSDGEWKGMVATIIVEAQS